MGQDWKKQKTSKGKWDTYKDGFRTEARWRKAVQHMKEAGCWLGEPKDIGQLIKVVQEDITDEEKEDIKEYLWKEFGSDLLRNSIRGLPEWYKKFLLEEEFNNE